VPLATQHAAIAQSATISEFGEAAALAAGGRLVRDEFAPSWWTLADAEGNGADIGTTIGRH
jgi:4a-hydroxytetrahydrobiopterin dehydratase